MSASKIISPIKRVLKRDKGGEGNNAETTSHKPPVATDYAVVNSTPSKGPMPSDGSRTQYDASGSHKVTSLEEYPLLASDATTPQAGLDILDARAELASARIIERIEPEYDEDENALSEVQLRRLYEDAEIERFLTMFADHVDEITLAPTEDYSPKRVHIVRSNFKDGRPGDMRIVPLEDETDSDTGTDDDEPWNFLNPNGVPDTSEPHVAPTTHTKPVPEPPRYLSARVAALIVSWLPPAPIAPPSTFRLGAGRIVGQRMYTSIYPFYGALLTDLIALAAWTDWYHSARMCAIWWVLWWFNMLLPALLGRLLYILLRRGLVRSLTLKGLRKRRRTIEEADAFGEAMEGQGAAASFFGTGSVPGIAQGGGGMGMGEMLKMGKLIAKEKGKKGKEKIKQGAHAVATEIGMEEEGQKENNDASEELDWRRSLLKVMEEIANFHERARNLFLWRRERSSRVYAFALAVFTLLVTLIPAQILAKSCYAVAGLSFWFGVPIVLAMPDNVFKRIPLPLSDVPSDIEYATSLISKRVTRGESALPVPRRTRDITRDRATWAAESGTKQSLEDMREEANEKEAVAAEERAASLGKEKIVTSTDIEAKENNRPNAGPMHGLKHQWEGMIDDLSGNNDDPNDSSNAINAPQTVSASHEATLGSLTLDSEAIAFTPLLTSTPHQSILLEQIQGIKKTRHASGIRIRYKTKEGDEHEVVFRLISNRDEMFGKLVGWGGKRWRKI
ncbi:short chain dehydrogenase [Ceratobasidium sp. AG-Ba]|nr:short chain dehydrogenase [Ceratobasidium sp. AG-Ba]